jgi:diaminohydroxyphosphoribosylaminopyrimidine deaminase/5-amino-6-(5-phosphoribosylamino)uracil reductase
MAGGWQPEAGSLPTDEQFISRALALAERGRGRTSPNPMVGAVVVDDEGVVVGRGAHEYAGGPHAEVHALAEAGERARGATLYCTLEPCTHTGRTGPCAPRVVEAGIRRAVIAVSDPNPLVAGRGIDLLRRHGIEVTVGVCAERARRLNPAFFTRMLAGRPFVTVKVALTLDGCVAAAPGVRSALTGAPANRVIHRERAEVDALAVGSGTVLVDDPLLTPRGAYRYRPLVRVVFDRRLRTPPSARLLSTLAAGPVIIVSTPIAAEQAPDRVALLAAAGAQVELVAPADEAPPTFLAAALARLTALDCTSMVVEGGPTLHAAFWRAGLVDRVQLFVTPHVAGPMGVAWDVLPIGTMAALEHSTVGVVGGDVLIEGYVHRPD